jgi:recombination protein U
MRTYKYPNGRVYISETPEINKKNNKYVSFGNRGTTFEEEINLSNEYYLNYGLAVIHKKPTPVQIVRVHYPKRSAAVIQEAYFRQASTTDYNGIYKGKYIDFEAKETRNKTLFPLQNIHLHQALHIKEILKHGGITFILIKFSTLNRIFFITGEVFITYWDRMQNNGKKSLSLEELVKDCYELKQTYNPHVNYLEIVDKHYF